MFSKCCFFIRNMKETNSRNGESFRKLNEGLNIFEKKNDEKIKQLEKVISAEIKARLVFFYTEFIGRYQ